MTIRFLKRYALHKFTFYLLTLLTYISVVTRQKIVNNYHLYHNSGGLGELGGQILGLTPVWPHFSFTDSKGKSTLTWTAANESLVLYYY